MRFIVVLLSLISGVTLSATSFHFPDIEFEYCKFYYFNINPSANLPEQYIYDENGFAGTILCDGIEVSKALSSNIEKLFLPGPSGILSGLSNCFIPRHGIVYFDKNKEPVASLSICFECGGARMWTKEKGKIKPTHFDDTEQKINSQINTLKNFLIKENMIISNNKSDYNILLNCLKEHQILEVNFKEKDSLILYNHYHKWNNLVAFKPLTIKDKFTKETQLVLSGNSNIKLNYLGKLKEAKIQSNVFFYDSKILIGANKDLVLSEITKKYNIDEVELKDRLTLTDHSKQISFIFEDDKLIYILMNFQL